MHLLKRAGSFSLRSHLIALVAITTVLMLGIAALAIARTASEYKASTSNRLTETARTLGRAVESDLNGKFTLLRTLSAAAQGDADSTQRMMERIAPQWGRVVVLPPGQSVSEVPELPGEMAAAMAAADHPLVSNLMAEPGGDGFRVAMGMAHPSAEGGPSSVLALITSPERLISIAPQSGTTEESLLVAITDGTGRVVARSRDSSRFVGKPVPDWAKLQALGAPRGLFEARTAEGGTVIFAFQKLANTPGWVVVTGEPLQNFNARWQQPLLRMVGGTAIALLLALILTAWVVRQVLRPVRALARSAQAVVAAENARGSAVMVEGEDGGGAMQAAAPIATSFRIREFESLRESIEAAQSALERRALAEHAAAEALKSSELRYRTLAQAGTLVLWRGRPDGPLFAVTGWEALTGDPEERALGMRWLERIHPDDLSDVQQALARVAQGHRQFDTEFRLRVRDEQWLWVRARGATVTNPYDEVIEWVGVVEDVDERHRAQERVAHMALHDALTGLPNRVEFRRRLDDAVKRAGRGESAAVLYVDLDRFKEVNDTLGHPVGDALLLAVTERLRSLVRDTDTVARLGGDEFAIVQSHVGEASDASGLAERVVDVIGAPYALNGHQVTIGASIGIALISQGVMDEPDALLKRADLALYRAKQQGRGRFCFFEQEMDASAQSRRKLELQLRQAYKLGQFALAYSPYVACQDNRVVGAEVCLHWNHPDKGMVPFRDYAALADEIGLAGVLGEWTVERACMDAVSWPAPARLAVSVGMAVLTRPGFAEFVGDVLGRTGLSPQRLELQVSERDLTQQAGRVLAALTKLKALGVQIVIASFGSEHSALGFLSAFDVDKVRMDAHFIADLAQRPELPGRVFSMAQLCQKFGVTLSADGVNTEDQRDMLRREGCAEVQGEVTGRLLWPDEVAEAL